MTEVLQIRTEGDPKLPALIYLPGLHGDWTLVTSFKQALKGKVFFVEMIYPRSLTWSIPDYAKAIAEELSVRNIRQGWLLGESFGSQVAWGLLENTSDIESTQTGSFNIRGIIFAGGFVKHPWKWGPPLLRKLEQGIPDALHKWLLKLYSRYAKFRHKHAQEGLLNIDEFIARRTKLDREVMAHRLFLLDSFDPRPIARKATIPIYYLAGLVDPLIPWPLVRHWLSKNCPGYQHGKTIWKADHNVLGTSPILSAKTIMDWVYRHEAKV